MPDFLSIAGAGKSFAATRVLDKVNLGVRRGEFVSLLGPSGCGKTTLLRIVAGLLRPDAGSVRLDGEDITTRPPHRRGIGVVFQNYALFPHLTVAENIAFGLEARRAAPAHTRATVARFLDLVAMRELANHSVKVLSGGQQQRVAVARALAVHPKLLLLDEPFSALDRKLRETMQIELKRLLRELATTAVFVTHDQDEALMMSDRIAVMNRGAIEQFADPATIYHRPATAFVLSFVGMSTRLSGSVVDAGDGQVVVATAHGPVRARGAFPRGAKAFVGVRPERMQLGPGLGRENEIEVPLSDIVFQGSKVQLHFTTTAGDRVVVETVQLPTPGVEPGAHLKIGFATADAIAFPAEAAP
jgi:putative spermidine/putrescine transport system ATP-binding protein